jgi:hypothetical protein
VSASEPVKVIRTVSKPPLLDLREIDDETSAFAPEGFCPWCDRRHAWVSEQRRAKRAPQRKNAVAPVRRTNIRRQLALEARRVGRHQPTANLIGVRFRPQQLI